MATTTLYLDTRRATKDGLYPVKLRVTHNRKSKYFKTTVYLDQESFDRILAGKYLSEDQKEIRKRLVALNEKASDIIDGLDIFSFSVLEERLEGKGSSSDLLVRFQERIAENKLKGKVGTAQIDGDTLASIKLFIKETQSKIDGFKLPLAQVTIEWLEQYEAWNIKRGISTTTIHIHNVRIRAIINQAIQKQIFDPKMYPYGKHKYKIPKPANNKRALTEDQLISFISYSPQNESERFAKDFFLFSLLSSGMNLGDVFSLKWSNFEGKESFTFKRRKTDRAGMSNEPKIITVFCRPEHWEIIERYGALRVGQNQYVFDVLKPGVSKEREHQLIKVAINKVNLNLKKISEALKLGFNITSYHARHTYATRLMGTAPLAYISQQLGHANLSTTQLYLSQFPAKESQKYEENLIPKIG